MATTTVYVLHHSFRGTPESGEIHSIYSTEDAALMALEGILAEDYDSTVEENEEAGHVYMYISEQELYA